ncbi:hypothetical protein B0H13DRAFT_2336777 [Mycena leptocephala]|nr:hypothetical protein B0H13DRAFT_2336777 [Mycena leptocephala]
MDPWAAQKAQAQAFFDSIPQHMRPKTVLSPPEASQRADKLRDELFASWDHLKKIVLAHEETIQKRWKKRTGAKRKQLLQEIDPKLPKQYAPEISALSAKQDKLNDFLLPYLNLADLTASGFKQSARDLAYERVRALLGLLHARVHYSPSQFAWFDYNTLGFGVVAGAIPRLHAVDCGMVVLGDDITYGKVLEYSEPFEKSDGTSPDGGQMEHTLRESMPFGDGLAVLDAQTKLMNFLLAVVCKILADLDLTELTPAAPLSAPVIPTPNTMFQWQSTARANTMRPYGPPPVFSIDDICSLIKSQYELAVQHLGDLRTDPMYFAETVQSYYDHRVETILGKAPPSLIQNRAIMLMLTDAYSFFVYYHVAKAIVYEFHVVQTRFPNGIPRARELPLEYEAALKNLYPILGLLELVIRARANFWLAYERTLCASSALRKGLSVRCIDAAFTKHEMAFTPQRGDELFSYMMILLQKQQTHLWRLVRVFDQIDRIIQDPAAHQRISPLIANILSHWGTVNDCKSILEWHRPAVEDDEGIQEAVQQRLEKWHPLIAPILSGNGPDAQLADKAFPSSRFTYPKGPRNAAWAKKCQAVDDDFSSFWTAADRLLVKRFGKELLVLGTQVVAPFVVTPTDWAALAAPKAVVRQKPTPAALVPFGGAQQSSAASIKVPITKVKPKTRGVAEVSAEGIQPAQNRELAATESSVVALTAVSTRVYKVFSTLFNAAKDEEIALQQSSVAWKDILTAFDQLGFKLRKTRGSAWTFSHQEGPKTVTVHEPHPESTMRFWEARRFGRRLTRRFGWTLESFVLDTTV